MANYIDKAKLVGEVLTNSEQQLRFRQMTGTEAYYEFLQQGNRQTPAQTWRRSTWTGFWRRLCAGSRSWCPLRSDMRN